MDSEQYEIRGRVIAQAYWDEMEKIAFFERAVLQKAAPGALADAWQYAAHAPSQAGLGWRRFVPSTATRAAHLAEKGRAATLKAQVQHELRTRENSALGTLADNAASAEQLAAAREQIASLRAAKQRVGFFRKEPMAPSLPEVQRSLSGGPAVADQRSNSTLVRRAALAGGLGIAGAGGLYAYTKMNQPAVPEYTGY